MERIFSNPQTVTVIMVFAIAIVAIIGYYVHEVLKTRSNNELKQSMLERGMTVQDIETVINAGTKPSKRHHRRAEHAIQETPQPLRDHGAPDLCFIHFCFVY
jgi:ABC-type bacteriocin/lantibiotic exporter with double-glycine peptidase domain